MKDDIARRDLIKERLLDDLAEDLGQVGDAAAPEVVEALAGELATLAESTSVAFAPASSRVDAVVGPDPGRWSAFRRLLLVGGMAAAAALLPIMLLVMSRGKAGGSGDATTASPTAWLFELDDATFRPRPEVDPGAVVTVDMTHISSGNGVQVLFVERR